MILYISIGLGLLLSWCIIIIAPGFKTAYDDRDLPEDKKRGVSIFPGVPFMPILVGIVAYFSNRYLSTWIAIGILELTPLRGHLTLGVKGVHDAHTVSPGVSRTDR